MTSLELFDTVSIRTSKLTTRAYSTSFSLGIFCLAKEYRNPIYSIYGWVRFADEIVDTFHDFDKRALLARFREDTYRAIHDNISLNPILNAFQKTVREFGIEQELTDTFLQSMEWDLDRSRYDERELKEYIVGSAEAVGLMCLRVFCNRDKDLYNQLKPFAMSLGSAFQKVNFLRDLKSDFSMGRVYFPELQTSHLTDQNKRVIEEGIQRDFSHALAGIRELPRGARLGVYVAYVYYLALFKKIKNSPSERILRSRIRVRNRHKLRLLAYSYLKHQLNLL